ncbi:MAG: hypothetical protein MZV70_66045 [Desulfobacterales bacterium]|nr:hypothetical protein [Desulfobacterales bacterium]
MPCITAANATAGATVVVPAGTYTLSDRRAGRGQQRHRRPGHPLQHDHRRGGGEGHLHRRRRHRPGLPRRHRRHGRP